MLPLLISTVISSIVTGGLITAIGYYVPIQLFCMVLFAVGGGLVTTFNLHTSTGKWFGYQVLTGAGIGVGFQSGVIVVQTVLPLSDVPVATACVSFFQTLGGALFIAVAQTLFQEGLLSRIRADAKELDATVFIHSGATQIRDILKMMGQEGALDVILQGYVDGLTHCFWITCACAIACFFVAAGLEWRSIKQGHGQEKEKEKVGGEMEEGKVQDLERKDNTEVGDEKGEGIEEKETK